jgi:hypothetical protein
MEPALAIALVLGMIGILRIFNGVLLIGLLLIEILENIVKFVFRWLRCIVAGG